MCDTCGCNVTPGNEHLVRGQGKHALTAEGKVAVEVLESLLSENDRQATHNRTHFDKHSVLAVNLMSSPGAGKTSLLEKTIDLLKDEYRIAVIEGDLETETDAQRLRARGVAAIQITTGSACHLDAHLVHDALHKLRLADLDLLFIENVGNLVCPASFDLGHHCNVTLLSVAEGDDKPAKYPVIFRAADVMLLTKADLLPVIEEFDAERAIANLRNLASSVPVYGLSSKTGQGMPMWIDWLRQQIATQRKHLAAGETMHPRVQSDGGRLHGIESAAL